VQLLSQTALSYQRLQAQLGLVAEYDIVLSGKGTCEIGRTFALA
jgi:hypothetical protein